MSIKRRDFLKSASILTGTALTLGTTDVFASLSNGKRSKQMNLRFQPYTLELKHTFTVAVNTRKTTPVVLTEIEYDGFVGYGEASMPPYLGESHETVLKFLAKVDLSRF